MLFCAEKVLNWTYRGFTLDDNSCTAMLAIWLSVQQACILASSSSLGWLPVSWGFLSLSLIKAYYTYSYICLDMSRQSFSVRLSCLFLCKRLSGLKFIPSDLLLLIFWLWILALISCLWTFSTSGSDISHFGDLNKDSGSALSLWYSLALDFGFCSLLLFSEFWMVDLDFKENCIIT